MTVPSHNCPNCRETVSEEAEFCQHCGVRISEAEQESDENIGAELREALSDHYVVKREIGRGGMATVYLAEDLKHHRSVAVKVLHEELAVALGHQRFLREIEITAGLNHPHILPLLDSGETAGFLYYVMPFMEGESLRDRLRRDTQLPIQETLRLQSEVVDALAYAHGCGVVHRDIKPENILISGGHAVVADFGIARAIRAAGGDRLTGTGLSLGTPAYMSPEQAAGAHDVDGRSDLYSLACVMFEMLAGEPPFTGLSPQAIIARHLSERPPSIRVVRPSVPLEVERIIEKALAKVPADRFATAVQYSERLERVCAEQIAAEVSGGIPRARKPVKWWHSHRTLGAMAAAVLFVAAVMVTANVIRGRNTERILLGDNVVGLAIFPFRPLSEDASEWSEGLPDFLAAALEGTQGSQVLDPWSLWRGLREDPSARAQSPDPIEAAQLALRSGARRFVLGSITRSANRFDVNVRFYTTEGPEAQYTGTFNARSDSMPALAQAIAVELITFVIAPGSTPSLRASEPPTTSANAFKAFLDAREAMRRGSIAEADVAIDRALRFDSSFALALVEAAVVKSWLQYMTGVPVTDLLGLAERAKANSTSLSERHRLRARAILASIKTDGTRAAEAANRIIQIDSSDFDAWATLAYSHRAYGWQYGAGLPEATAAAERVVQLDSTNVPGLVVRAELAAIAGDTADIQRQMRRLSLADTTNPLMRGTDLGLHMLLAIESGADALAERIAQEQPEVWLPTLRLLRAVRPDRAEMLVSELVTRGSPGRQNRTVLAEGARLALARGHFAQVDSAIKAGIYGEDEVARTLERMIVAASLTGLVDTFAVHRSIESLAEYVPIDSAVEYIESRRVIETGWTLAAFHAMHGDTLIARRWQAKFDELPAFDVGYDYRGALRSDISARLAARRGALEEALESAERAVELWDIHSSNAMDDQPEPGMRFHLAQLLRAGSRGDSAAAIFRSLVPPTTWLGFYTGRAALELAELSQERGNVVASRRYYLIALALWENGEPAVRTWQRRASNGLQRLPSTYH